MLIDTESALSLRVMAPSTFSPGPEEGAPGMEEVSRIVALVLRDAVAS